MFVTTKIFSANVRRFFKRKRAWTKHHKRFLPLKIKVRLFSPYRGSNIVIFHSKSSVVFKSLTGPRSIQILVDIKASLIDSQSSKNRTNFQAINRLNKINKSCSVWKKSESETIVKCLLFLEEEKREKNQTENIKICLLSVRKETHNTFHLSKHKIEENLLILLIKENAK